MSGTQALRKEVTVTAFPLSATASLDPRGPGVATDPKYYAVKRQLLEPTQAMAPGSPVPPDGAAQQYGTSRTTVRQALAEPRWKAGGCACRAGPSWRNRRSRSSRVGQLT